MGDSENINNRVVIPNSTVVSLTAADRDRF